MDELVLSETCAVVTDNVSSELLKERRRLFENEAGLDVHYLSIDYSWCNNDRLKGSTVRLACPGVRIATVVTCLINWERLGDYGHKIYAGTYAQFVTEAFRQLAEHVRLF